MKKIRVTYTQVATYDMDAIDHQGMSIEDALRHDIKALLSGPDDEGHLDFDSVSLDFDSVSEADDVCTYKFELVTFDDEGNELFAVEYDDDGNPKNAHSDATADPQTPRGVGTVTDADEAINDYKIP